MTRTAEPAVRVRKLKEPPQRPPFTDRTHLWWFDVGRQLARTEAEADDKAAESLPSALEGKDTGYKRYGRSYWEYSLRDTGEVWRNCVWSENPAGKRTSWGPLWKPYKTMTEEQRYLYETRQREAFQILQDLAAPELPKGMSAWDF